jgi:hypothetical protein
MTEEKIKKIKFTRVTPETFGEVIDVIVGNVEECTLKNSVVISRAALTSKQKARFSDGIDRKDNYSGYYCYLSEDGTTGFCVNWETNELCNLFSTNSHGKEAIEFAKTKHPQLNLNAFASIKKIYEGYGFNVNEVEANTDNTRLNSRGLDKLHPYIVYMETSEFSEKLHSLTDDLIKHTSTKETKVQRAWEY